MPAKKQHLTDDERAKRIREAAKEHETSNDTKDFERAFGKVVHGAKTEGRAPDRRSK